MPVEEDDNGAEIGPVPLRGGAEEEAQEREQLRARRAALLSAAQAEERKPKREEWMMQLPKQLNKYGLGPRQFRQGQGSSKEADSTWTESPSERGKPKAVVPNGAEAKHTKERDAKQQEVADSINKNRKESLMEIHNRKRKAESQHSNEGNGTERRPFDREKDMQVRGLKSNLASVTEKCAEFRNQFEASTSRKFL